MNNADLSLALRPAGVRFGRDLVKARRQTFAWLEQRQLQDFVSCRRDVHGLSFALAELLAADWTPLFDTTGLAHKLALDTQNDADLEREIVLAMLASPRPLVYPSFEEFAAAVRVRREIVRAAGNTQLAFKTGAAERPADCWAYSDETGFILVPGARLIPSLVKATQPVAGAKLYTFSCYRATEYVILLGLARELERTNPDLLARLQQQWETRAIVSGAFHAAFLFELGSLEEPLPAGYYVPGDRVWFRNPDERSADVEGFEGSWVFYLGAGLFSNFWKHKCPFTMTSKCVELFHWRDGVRLDAQGKTYMDEALVEERAQRSLADPEAVQRILSRMYRLRDPRGVYADGGCIDATREFPRYLCPGTDDLRLGGA